MVWMFLLGLCVGLLFSSIWNWAVETWKEGGRE